MRSQPQASFAISSPSRQPVARLSPGARAVAAAWLLAGPLVLHAQAPLPPATLPSGLQVAAGQASLATQGAQMTVRNTPGAILNWQGFSIGASAGVHFEQANAASKVLNRVSGPEPSLILGSLTSNGQVWLLNPNGVLFGQGARVDVGSLVAGTLRLADTDFLAGRYRFSAADAGGGAVRNEGSLKSAFGGQVVLLGERVQNTGDISAPGGRVSLAAARSVELVDTGVPHLSVRVDVAAGEVFNAGRLIADGGTVDVFAGIVNQQGLVRADTLGADAQGRIVLRAADTLMLGEHSRTQAGGTAAGTRGGQVDLLGAQVGVLGQAVVDVAGDAGGGAIRLGGGLQGQDRSVPNARAVYLGPAATLDASASGVRGDGGSIILWSDQATRAYGTLAARGARRSGDGGFVETSGGWLDARPAAVDVSAAAGRSGLWLLDPNNILINDTGPNANISAGPSFTSTNDSSVITTATLATALNAGNSVSVVTASAGSNAQAGDIVMDGATLSVNPGSAVTLTLQASRDVLVRNSSITSTGQPLSLTLQSAGAGVGAIEIGNSSISTAGGNVTLRGASSQQVPLPGGGLSAQAFAVAVGYDAQQQPFASRLSLPQVGVLLTQAQFNLGAGSFSAHGLGALAASGVGGEGVFVAPGSSITAANIALSGWSPGFTAAGLLVSGDATRTASLVATQSLALQGGGLDGVAIENGARLGLNAPGNAAATLSIKGEGTNFGVVVDDASASNPNATRITVVGGSISIDGRSTAAAAPAVLISDRSGGSRGTDVLDLGAAAGLQISGSSGGSAAAGIQISGVSIAGPGSGSTTLAATSGGLDMAQVALTGAGSYSLRGESVTLTASTLGDANASAPMNLDFATTGASPQGLFIRNTIITTSGGDVRFGAIQNVSSTRLGSTTVAAPWVEYAGSGALAGLNLIDSVIDAGAGRVYGGGAARSNALAAGGLEIFRSNINAREIDLRGRTDGETGLLVDGTQLVATRVLALEGLSANAGSTPSPGLHVDLGSTLQLIDPTVTAGSQMTLRGSNLGGFTGVLLAGGNAGSSNETRLVVSGASLLVDGNTNAGGIGLQASGASAAPGGLLINALGATAVTLQGATASGVGNGLLLQYANLLGPQGVANAPLQLLGNGRDANGGPGTRVESSNVSTGGTLLVRGDAVAVSNSQLSGEAGLNLHTNLTGAPAMAGNIVVSASNLSTGAAAAALRLEAVGGGAAQGDARVAGGAGISLSDSTLSGLGAGASVVLNGEGSASAGEGVVFARTPMTAANIVISGRALLDNHGVLSNDFSGGAVSLLSATNVTISGTSANVATAPTRAGVNLGNAVALQLSGRGAVSISGDSVVLGNFGGTQPFRAAGDAASFTVSSVDSQRLRNTTLDFSRGSGTAVTLRADSDGLLGGRARLESSSVNTGGGNFTGSGVGVRRGATPLAPGNATVLDGAAGFFLTASTIDAGTGTVSLTAVGPNDGNPPAGFAGNAALLVNGSSSITAASIVLNGDAGDRGRGVDIGVTTAGAQLHLTANQVSVSGRGAGVDPGTSLPYEGVALNSASNWLASGNLALTSSASGMALTGVNFDATTMTLNAAGALGLAASTLDTSSSLTLLAAGAGVNGSLLSIAGSAVRAGAALQITGNASGGGSGVAVLTGSTLAGSSVAITGTGGGVSFFDTSGSAPTVTASSGALSITGRGGFPGLAFTGAWALSAPTAITLNTDDGLGLLPANGFTALPRFNAGQRLTLAVVAPLGLTVGSGFPLDGAALSSAVAGMAATATVTLNVTGNPNSVTFRGPLTVPARLAIQADGIELQAGAVLSSTAAGDAIVLGGTSAAEAAFINNTAGAGALSAANGRWVLRVSDPRNTALGGLAPDFTAYNLASQPWATDASGNLVTPLAGNALAYGVAPSAVAGQGLAGAQTRAYDATTLLTLNPAAWAVSGLVGGDTLVLSGTTAAQLADKNVGSAKPVTLNAGSLFSVNDANGRPVLGYGAPTFSATITPVTLNASGAAVAAKVYDGSALARLASLGSVTPLAGDSVAVGGSVVANFGDKNVGSNKPVAASGFALTGADAGNYLLVAPSGLTGSITPLALAVTGLAALSKVYDTTAVAGLSGSAAINPLAGDTVLLAGSASARFADKNVGAAKPVTVSGLSLAGSDANNYTLQAPAGLVAAITPATLPLSGLAAASRVYDGSTTAALLGSAVVTPLAGDTVSLAGTVAGTFASRNVGNARPVTVGGLSLAGPDAGNYSLRAPSGLVANITPALLGLAGVTAVSRVYDGGTAAVVSGSLTGLVAGDNVSLSLSGLFADRNVGLAKPVAYSAGTSGTDAGNYTLATPGGSSSASITAATLSYGATPLISTVGLTLPPLGGQVSGFVGGDTLANSTSGLLAWTTPATAAGPAGSYAITGSGLAALNYQFVQAAGNATALTLRAPTTSDPTTTANTIATTAALLSVQVPLAMSTPTQGRVLDVTTAFAPSAAWTAVDGRAYRASGSGADGSGTAAAGGGAAAAPGGAATSAAPGASAIAQPPGSSTAAAASGEGTASGLASSSSSAAAASGLAALSAASEVAEGLAFRPLDFSSIPRDEVETLLAARARYKQSVFSGSVYRLQQDPSLADVRACRSEPELSSGMCVITEQLKAQIQAARAAAAATAAASSTTAQPQRAGQRRVKQAALPTIERKLALIIGVNEYTDKRVPQLFGAVPDAMAVRALLEQRLGYETTLLANPSREAVIRAFNQLALEAEANDSVIIYYAGHGVLVPIDGVETGFWLSSDINAERPDTWLANADIARLIAAVGARQLMLVSDSCYSGALVGKDRVQLSTPSDAADMLKRRAAVAMSSGGDEPVADQGKNGHSVFAWHFLRALQGLDEWQVGGSLFERLRSAVSKEFPQTPQYGASRSAGHQGNTDYLFERRELEAAAPAPKAP